MSDAGGDGDDPGLVRRTARTVTPAYFGRSDSEMNAVGVGLALGLVVLLVPLLPFILVVLAVTKLVDFLRSQTS